MDIILKKGVGIPVSLEEGEPAIDTINGNLYIGLENDQVKKIGGIDVASGNVVTITVPTTGWTTTTDTNGTTYYTIKITNSILTSDGYPVTDVVLPSDIAAARLQAEAYQSINKITVNDGSVDLYCFDSLPTVSFQIRIQILYI